MRVTACQCEQAGWCERHQRYKSHAMVKICQRVPRVFRQWEVGGGPPLPAAAAYEPLRNPCIHRGAVQRTVACSSCQGDVQVKVFACALHDECVLKRGDGLIARCVKCDEYENSSES